VASGNTERRCAGLPEIRGRIGLHTGEVIVGNIGAPGRINCTIVGNTVNVANRLEQLGKDLGGTESVTILLCAATADAARAAIDAVALGTHAVRGQHEPMAVYRL